jgi:SAM-dependent methyltransferase
MGFPQVRRWRLTKPRAGVYPLRNLLNVIGSVRGLNILEIGPGDFMTSGLALLAAGAQTYTVIDRFVGDYEKPEAKVWYRGIQDAWPRLFPDKVWPEYLRAEDCPEAYADRVKILTGTIEEATAPKQYDVVCSYQVGEHVDDVDAFARANSRFLKPGGVAVHRVDFGPHDCWAFYEDRLTFLRFPDWLWRLMGSNRGTPNRKRFHEVRTALEDAGLKVDVMGLELFSDEMVANSRPNKNFTGMPFESLKVGTAIFVCRI